MTAELSNNDVHFMRFAGEQPISEQPNESEHPSSPAGTIGEVYHDVMSEHIESKIHKFSKGSLAHQNHVAALDEAEMSNLAGKSENTKLSKVAEVSPSIPLIENKRNL